ncbi:porin family protein [Phenylobacterium parvum]|nr:porin family protein [Phenylobacterium parvum]
MINRFATAAGFAAVLISAGIASAEPFSGAYAGVALSSDSFEARAEDLIETGDKFDGLSVNGVGFGGYAGYDFPVGERMFLGLQMGIESSSSEFTASDGFSRIKLEAGRSFDIGGRAGVMVNDATALYGRLAWGQTNFKASVDDESDDRDLSAWRLGGGLETRLNEQVGLRVEYLYSAYEDEAGLEPSGSQFRAGLNWRF